VGKRPAAPGAELTRRQMVRPGRDHHAPRRASGGKLRLAVRASFQASVRIAENPLRAGVGGAMGVSRS
jgi:hypothetical protein